MSDPTTNLRTFDPSNPALTARELESCLQDPTYVFEGLSCGNKPTGWWSVAYHHRTAYVGYYTATTVLERTDGDGEHWVFSYCVEYKELSDDSKLIAGERVEPRRIAALGWIAPGRGAPGQTPIVAIKAPEVLEDTTELAWKTDEPIARPPLALTDAYLSVAAAFNKVLATAQDLALPKLRDAIDDLGNRFAELGDLGAPPTAPKRPTMWAAYCVDDADEIAGPYATREMAIESITEIAHECGFGGCDAVIGHCDWASPVYDGEFDWDDIGTLLEHWNERAGCNGYGWVDGPIFEPTEKQRVSLVRDIGDVLERHIRSGYFIISTKHRETVRIPDLPEDA